MMAVTAPSTGAMDHAHAHAHQDVYAPGDDQQDMENRLCPGCRQSVLNENGGLVVAFGNSFFHVDCFKCAKCGDQVTADTNLLLLSDGSPICANCSYSCNICRQPILDEAIMTGDESYHAHCFKCKLCKSRIDELMFAKTSQGIYCMNCHNERMAKIRKHAQKKRERERAAGGSGSTKSREREANEFHKQNGMGSPSVEAGAGNSDPVTAKSRAPLPVVPSPTTPQIVEPSVNGIVSAPQPLESPGQVRQLHEIEGTAPHSFSTPSVTVAPPVHIVNSPPTEPHSTSGGSPSSSGRDPSPLAESSSTSLGYLRDGSPSAARKDSLPIPPNGEVASSLQERRKSFDDGTRPLNILFKNKNQPPSSTSSPSPVSEGGGGVQGLQVPSKASRSEKRRSINPGLALNNFNFAAAPPPAAVQAGPPQPATHSPSSPAQGRESPRVRSPLRDQFPDPTNAQSSSNRSSPAEGYHIPDSVSSRNAAEPGSDQQGVRARAATASTYLPEDGSARPPDPLRPPLRTSNTSERVPTASAHIRTPSTERSDPHGRLSPGPGLRMQRSFDDRPRVGSPLNEENRRLSSPLSLEQRKRTSGSRSRPSTPLSPNHNADVPHNIESGTDTENEGDSGHGQSVDDHDTPPAPPPKEGKDKAKPQELSLSEEGDTTVGDMTLDPDSMDSSYLSMGDGEDASVERTSIATFIAPALPPIRFSMNGADFGDLLNGVGGSNFAAFKSLDKLVKLAEDQPLTTPPATANSFSNAVQIATPINDSTFVDSSKGNPSTPSAAGAIQRSKTVETTSSPSTSSLSSEKTVLKRSNTLGPSEAVARPEDARSQSSTETRMRSSSESSPPSVKHKGSLRRRDKPDPLQMAPGMNLRPAKSDTAGLVMQRLQEALTDASDRGAQQLKLDKTFVEVILQSMEQQRTEANEMKGKLDGAKRVSKQYIDGLTVAQTEYDHELKARRNAEAEVTRLRVLLSGQAARLTALSGETRRQEVQQHMSREMSNNLTGLERDLSKLKVQRDMVIAEVEELSGSKSTEGAAEAPTSGLGRSLTVRLDKIKNQYERDLVPLTQQREALTREIAELKAVRDVFLEETTALNARNEELAQLSAQYARRVENSVSASPAKEMPTVKEERERLQKKPSTSFDKARPQAQAHSTLVTSNSASTTTSSQTLHDDVDARHPRYQKPEPELPAPTPRPPKIMKWPGSKKVDRLRDPVSSVVVVEQAKPGGKGRLEHTFQQLSILRFTRCDHCGDKMWGSQLRCSGCNISVHVRCINHVQVACTAAPQMREEPLAQLTALPPSMFGRNLTEQVEADAKGDEDRLVPVIVEKCIDAVEALALDYEGIYRKNGGSGQSKAITQLFERGDYNAFDLRDDDRFNDICAVTSVLKSYFRSLPVPLLTHDLHESFIMAAEIKDPALKKISLWEVVNKLPDEHYHTLRMLMLHLHRVMQHSEVNLMTSRNIGVVFGPTLMRSRDPAAEFSDMAGKALTIEWLVENASVIFEEDHSPS